MYANCQLFTSKALTKNFILSREREEWTGLAKVVLRTFIPNQPTKSSPTPGSPLVSTYHQKFTHCPASARKLLSGFKPDVQSTLENAQQGGAD